MGELLLSQPKQTAKQKADMLIEFVEILLQDGAQKDGSSPGFSAFSRLLKDKRVWEGDYDYQYSGAYYFIIIQALQTELNKYLAIRKKKDVDEDAAERQLKILAQLLPVTSPDKSLEHFTKVYYCYCYCYYYVYWCS